jgi:hypothetical protein
MPFRALEVGFAEHVPLSTREGVLDDMRIHYGVEGSVPVGDVARLYVPVSSVASLATFLHDLDLQGTITYRWAPEDQT